MLAINDVWQGCKNVLCVRLDNMGDILMSVPAINSVKESLGCRVTLLTSNMGEPITGMIPSIDDVLVFDAPWVKGEGETSGQEVSHLISNLRSRAFDAAIIFTVCSQNPLPTALLLYLAEIPRRLAFCRENPYGLLTHWVPDDEPYDTLRHQVARDLHLVHSVGIQVTSEKMTLEIPHHLWPAIIGKLGWDINSGPPWIIFHAGVSETKREYSPTGWIELGRKMRDQGFRILLTGGKSHSQLLFRLRESIGFDCCIALPGILSMEEFVVLINHAPIVITVNTIAAHIAAAVQTPVIVLYAETNPQHTPWKVPHRIFTFPVSQQLKSRNAVLKFIYDKFSVPDSKPAETGSIVDAIFELMGKTQYFNVPYK